MMLRSVYLATNTIDQFRWVGFEESSSSAHGVSEFGILLAQLRWDPLSDRWEPPPIEWLEETINRPTCDIPNFRPTMWCLNSRALAALRPMLAPAGEIMKLDGLGGEYVAFNCLERYNALDREALEALRVKDPYYRIASTRGPVPLLRDRIGSAHLFKIPEAITQTFVSAEFKQEYEAQKLTGLDFFEVDLR